MLPTFACKIFGHFRQFPILFLNNVLRVNMKIVYIFMVGYRYHYNFSLVPLLTIKYHLTMLCVVEFRYHYNFGLVPPFTIEDHVATCKHDAYVCC